MTSHDSYRTRPECCKYPDISTHLIQMVTNCVFTGHCRFCSTKITELTNFKKENDEATASTKATFWRQRKGWNGQKAHSIPTRSSLLRPLYNVLSAQQWKKLNSDDPSKSTVSYIVTKVTTLKNLSHIRTEEAIKQVWKMIFLRYEKSFWWWSLEVDFREIIWKSNWTKEGPSWGMQNPSRVVIWAIF